MQATTERPSDAPPAVDSIDLSLAPAYAAAADPSALRSPSSRMAVLSALSTAVVACGGGGGTSSVAAPPRAVALSSADAARFLIQASFGADRAEIERTRGMGVAAWLDEQFAMPRGQTHVDWLRAQSYEAIGFENSRAPMDYSVWRKFLSSTDQLRQRMVYALSQILVVAVEGIGGRWPAFGAGYYLDILETHAFGNFRNLLEDVTLSPAMGNYLSMRGSRKTDASGRQPDENYAREVMQLFTIGLSELNADGSERMAGSATIDTYGQADVTGLARVFTGWDYSTNDVTTAASVVTPMVNTASRHESGVKTFLGITVPANTSGQESLRLALDRLFTHANVGPFIARQLIQRLVMSNPSAAYVGRVAAAFADNGAGVRGDLKATLRAVLTDGEARDSATALASPAAGKLREPVLRFAQWARAARVGSASGQWKLGNLSDPATRLGQSPLHSPSVFNFYRPGYVPPNTAIASAGQVAPEFQITTESSVAGYLNFMQTAIATTNGVTGSDVKPDYSVWLALADDASALADEASLVLAANQISAARVAIVRDAVAAMPSATAAQLQLRVQAALLLTLAAPEYLALR
jgi:uncharacterized protein (DUF1800 family)